MGSGIGAGAFMEGFYKGFTMIDKSLQDRQDRLDKEDKAKKELESKQNQMMIEQSRSNEAYEKQDLEYVTKGNEYIDNGDFESYNKIVDNRISANKTHNETIGLVNSSYGKDVIPFKQLKPEETTKLSKFNYDGKDYIVPSNVKDKLDNYYANSGDTMFVIQPDGSLGVKQELDKQTATLSDSYSPTDSKLTKDMDRQYDAPIGSVFKQFNPKADKTKDSDLVMAWKNYNMSSKENISLEEFKKTKWEKETTSTSIKQYTVDGKVMQLTAQEALKLQKEGKKVLDYEKPSSDKYRIEIDQTTGEVIKLNENTGSVTRIDVGLTPKRTEGQKDFFEAQSVSNDVMKQIELADEIMVKNPKAFGSLVNPLNYTLNKLGDVIKPNTPDSASRQKYEQFKGDTIITLAKLKQVGVLTDKDYDRAVTLIPSVDSEIPIAQEASKRLKDYVKRKVNEKYSTLSENEKRALGDRADIIQTKQDKAVSKTASGTPIYEDSKGQYIIKDGKKVYKRNK